MHQKNFFLKADFSAGIDRLNLIFWGGFHMAIMNIVDTL
jgi:hypothetical protein